jgi:hypothetical protein
MSDGIDVDDGNEEDIDVESFTDMSSLNEQMAAHRNLSQATLNSRNSPRLRHLKGRKRRLSFGDVGKKIDSVNENMEEYKHLWASISPPKKVPKITIRMRRDPVLVKELENTKSESVRFKLESPLTSVSATPESSDQSDSDEEESPLNCTRYRPFISSSSRRSARSLYKEFDSFTDRACPKLMRIKFGDTQIAINIPQQKLMNN